MTEPSPVPQRNPLPPKRRAGAAIAGFVGLVGLIGAGLAGCGGKTAPNDAAPPTTHSTTAAAPTPTAAPAYSGPLQDLVIPKPASATLTPDERKGAADGSLTLNDVASEYTGSSVSTVKGLLGRFGFQRGVFLAWRDSGTLVYIEIYQFQADPGAAGWIQTQDSVIEDAATSTAVFDEIEGGRWFVTKTADGRGGAHALFSKGPLAVMINTFRTGAADLDGTKKMAIDQYHRLP